MKKEIAELLVDHGSLELHEEYSGRGMYGSTTTAVVGSTPDLLNSICEAYKCLMEELNCDGLKDGQIDEAFSKAKEIQNAVTQIRTDSLGYDTIFY
jgi:hypothetical protein